MRRLRHPQYPGDRQLPAPPPSVPPFRNSTASTAAAQTPARWLPPPATFLAASHAPAPVPCVAASRLPPPRRADSPHPPLCHQAALPALPTCGTTTAPPTPNPPWCDTCLRTARPECSVPSQSPLRERQYRGSAGLRGAPPAQSAPPPPTSPAPPTRNPRPYRRLAAPSYAAPRLTAPPSPSLTPSAPLELQSPSFPCLLPLTGNMSTACCNRSLGICPVWKPHPCQIQWQRQSRHRSTL